MAWSEGHRGVVFAETRCDQGGMIYKGRFWLVAKHSSIRYKAIVGKLVVNRTAALMFECRVGFAHCLQVAATHKRSDL